MPCVRRSCRSRGRPRCRCPIAQRRLWFLDRLEGSAATYNIPLAVRLTGALDRAALRGALGDVVERHESLRTVFPDGTACRGSRSLPADAARPALEIVDGRRGGTAAALDALRPARGFDLASEMPLRAHLFELGADEHVLLIVLHHIAGDGWSLAPLGRDLSAFYRARCDGTAAALPPLPVQYADYTLWQQAALGDEAIPAAPSRASLRTGRARSTACRTRSSCRPTGRGRRCRAIAAGRCRFRVPAELHARACGRSRATPGRSLFMVLQAALAALLSRLGAGTDIPIGSPIAGRTDAALDDLVGFFVNTLVLRTDTSGQPSFRELVGRVRADDLAAYAHQDLPFERLVEVLNPARSLSRHPLFQVMLAFETQSRRERAGLRQGSPLRRSRSPPRAPSSTCRSG